MQVSEKTSSYISPSFHHLPSFLRQFSLTPIYAVGGMLAYMVSISVRSLASYLLKFPRTLLVRPMQARIRSEKNVIERQDEMGLDTVAKIFISAACCRKPFWEGDVDMWFDVVVCGDQEYQFNIHFFLLLILFSSVEYLPVRDIDRPPSSPLVDATDSPCGKLW